MTCWWRCWCCTCARYYFLRILFICWFCCWIRWSLLSTFPMIRSTMLFWSSISVWSESPSPFNRDSDAPMIPRFSSKMSSALRSRGRVVCVFVGALCDDKLELEDEFCKTSESLDSPFDFVESSSFCSRTVFEWLRRSWEIVFDSSKYALDSLNMTLTNA